MRTFVRTAVRAVFLLLAKNYYIEPHDIDRLRILHLLQFPVMLADSLSDLSLTAALWQIGHTELKTWQHSLAVYDRDIHLVCAQLDSLDSLLTASMQEQYDFQKLNGQATQSSDTTLLSSHPGGCFASFRCGILSKKSKFNVLPSEIISLEEHEGSAICATLEDIMSGEHVNVIGALLCSNTSPTPESKIQVFLRKPVRSKSRDFIIWGGLHQTDRWTGKSAPNKFQVCRCRISDCLPYAYMFCSDHCHVETSDNSQAVTVETMQPLVSVKILSQLSINQSYQMNTHDWRAQLKNQELYQVCGSCGVLRSDQVCFRCPGQRLQDLPTTGSFCEKCNISLNTVEVSQAFESCFKCNGLYINPLELIVNRRGVTQCAFDLLVYEELAGLLCAIAFPEVPPQLFQNERNLLELFFKEIHNVLSTSNFNANDLYQLVSDDFPDKSSMESLIRRAGETFVSEHGVWLEPVTQSVPKIEVKYKFLDDEMKVLLSGQATFADLKYKIFPELERNMLSSILVSVDGKPMPDTVLLSSFNYNSIVVTVDFA